MKWESGKDPSDKINPTKNPKEKKQHSREKNILGILLPPSAQRRHYMIQSLLNDVQLSVTTNKTKEALVYCQILVCLAFNNTTLLRNIPTSVRDELSIFSKITWLLPTISPISIC